MNCCRHYKPNCQTSCSGECNYCKMNHKMYCYYLEGYRNLLRSRNKQICLMEYFVNQMQYLKSCIQQQLEQCCKPVCQPKCNVRCPASSRNCCCKACSSKRNNINYSELIERLNFINHKLSCIERQNNCCSMKDCAGCRKNKSSFLDDISFSCLEKPLMCSKRNRCASCPIELCFEMPSKCCKPSQRKCCCSPPPQSCCCSPSPQSCCSPPPAQCPPPQSCCCQYLAGIAAEAAAETGVLAGAQAALAGKKDYDIPKEPLIFEVCYTTNKYPEQSSQDLDDYSTTSTYSRRKKKKKKSPYKRPETGGACPPLIKLI